MRRFLKFTLWLVLLVATAGGASASFDDSKAWFENLSHAEQVRMQTNLILLGHYHFPADGKFGASTYEALLEFQRTLDQPPSGVLTSHEQEKLRGLAVKVDHRFGMERVNDGAGHVFMTIPSRLFPIRAPTDAGTSYASADGEISLETMHASLSEHSFRELYESVISPDDERTIEYEIFSDDRFVVSGTLGDYSFYTMFVTSGHEAVGYSLAWGKSYADEGKVASLWIASHFTPIAHLPPFESPDGGPPPVFASTFKLPDDQTDAIVLDGDITGSTAADFDRAIAARPDARKVILDSNGGRVDSALIVAKEVRRRGLETYVPAGMGCYSACAYIFFAGTERQVDGELGVHQISAHLLDMVTAQSILGDVFDALQDFGVDRRVVSHMLRTPPDNMYVFSSTELTSLGINRGDFADAAVKVASIGPEQPELVRPPSVAFVQLSRQSTLIAAERSLDYAKERWGKLFGGVQPELELAGDIYLVRLPLDSLTRANVICNSIKTQGGGCYVTDG